MAAHERLIPKAAIASPLLIQRLAKVLPKDVAFKLYHLSTPPTRTSAIYSTPPRGRPERTYCESHFLTVSIQISPAADESPAKEALIFAIEVLIYSTAHSTTFFVSKADSTGYVHLLRLPTGTPSPLRETSSTFLQHLIEQRQRSNTRSVVSLFARAQDQYLFPGSIENDGKHVLDDRGLVRWWCRVLNPLVENAKLKSEKCSWSSIKGYLLIPGLDTYETTSYIPSKVKPPSQDSPWTVGHPLQEIARNPESLPPRCLIPHYPDDPKSRFLDELDDEISKGERESVGRWKSVNSVDQFWEMMAFRQECSAGRLVGFIWLVFNPDILSKSSVSSDSQTTVSTDNTEIRGQSASISTSQTQDHSDLALSPMTSYGASSQVQPSVSPLKSEGADVMPVPEEFSNLTKAPPAKKQKKKKLTGRIVPRQPRIKTKNRNYILERPENTAYYRWNAEGRGQVIVEEGDYSRITELLLRLDFANIELATSSSRRWILEVKSSAWGEMSDAWGQTVVGTRETQVQVATSNTGVNTLTMGLVRKKRKPGAELDPPAAPASNAAPVINVLSSGMIRKKVKS
ncbi:hypothetical protein BP5796_00838 [Coleophoma crateriformis]|uniref:histone acetyltransferase n=1 Tax=Coleophoma crateriformis TaxID=565419 RepID=A0A3D8T970_9HELO|nr:hypothetical protein BP5796_00838 [Coleophoma crateriformis]